MAPPVAESSCPTAEVGWSDQVINFFATDGMVPVAILLSATVALAVGVFGWWQNRRLNREQAALSLLLNQQHEHRRDALAVWLLIQRGADFGELVKSKPLGADGQEWQSCQEWNLPLEQRQFMVVNRLLKYYEAIATAIRRNIIDKGTVRRFMGPNIVYYVENLYPFIVGSRGDKAIGNDDVWKDIETLAKKWGAKVPKK